MASIEDKNSQNVPGRFYVDNNCISCGLCCDTAPDFFKLDDDSGVAYVYRQPTTDAESDICEEAKDGCPVDAIGDDGE